MRWIVAAVLVVASCGVRAPAPVDVAALVARRGPVEARRDLTIRVLANPRDVQARLALAELGEKHGRPSEAIVELEAVVRLGGPIGIRWHDADRERLGRLLLARGRARLMRGAPTALADLERAGSLGASATADELVSARVGIAITRLRHVDAKERAKGRATLAGAAKPAKPGPEAGPEMERASERLRAGTDEASWLGAKSDASVVERGTFGAWLWTVGARREAYVQLEAWHAATKPPRDETLQGAYLRALAWWSPLWLGEVPPPPAEDLVGAERCLFPGADCVPLGLEAPPLPPIVAIEVAPRAAVAARFASTRFVGALDAAALAPIAAAFSRDPAISERLGRDLVASSVDAAIAQATLGALFDALGDPARARAAWHAAVDLSPEREFVRGLAESAARTGDGPAALVFGTAAAAAWGDPAVVWTSVADALLDAGQYVDGLTAARSALDLAGPEVLPRALDVAIAASRSLGRASQADAMLVQRAQLAPVDKTEDAEARTALSAHRQMTTAWTIARLWVVSRARPRDVELRVTLLDALDQDDPRRDTLVTELVALSGEPDSERALAAVGALR